MTAAVLARTFNVTLTNRPHNTCPTSQSYYASCLSRCVEHVEKNSKNLLELDCILKYVVNNFSCVQNIKL